MAIIAKIVTQNFWTDYHFELQSGEREREIALKSPSVVRNDSGRYIFESTPNAI